MRCLISLTLFAILALSGAHPARADSATFFHLGPEVSTLGLGGEAGVRVNDFLGIRVGGNYFETDFDASVASTDYDLDFTLQSAGAVIDVYPFGGGLRLSAGLRWNGNNIDLSVTPTNSIAIGGTTFTAAELGTLSGDLDFDDFAPLAGFGYEAGFLDDRLLLAFGAGVLFQGDPEVDLSATGTLATDASLLAALQREENDIENDLEFLGFYPVLSLSLTFRF
ncbi:MAG: hypothetical protein ACE5LF_08755 [Alphaproteobacteria bacterium]